MKYLTSLFIIMTSLLTGPALAENQYYVWQQQWSTNVIAAVRAEAATTLYPIATVIPPHGQSQLVDIPWNKLSKLPHRYVPVIRIPLSAFNRDDIGEELARTTRAIIQSAPEVTLSEIQFDLDCPERRLSEYTELVQRFRKQSPELRLSITALPCHLNNKSFRALAKSSDYYVLQVHGLDVPKTIHENAELLNLQTAQKALRQADALGHPFCVALPCYAYELNFHPESGEFLFLTAEKTSRRTDTHKKRIAAKHTDLIELQTAAKTSTYAQGIIWFRLPVAGDQLCLPRPTLAAIQSGIIPEPDVQYRIQPVSESTIELELHNHNTIHASQAVLKLSWPEPNGTFDLYHDLSAVRPAPGRLPTDITVPMPPPGSSTKIGWFQASPNHHPKIEIILQ
jgi:hypothetical protein